MDSEKLPYFFNNVNNDPCGINSVKICITQLFVSGGISAPKYCTICGCVYFRNKIISFFNSSTSFTLSLLKVISFTAMDTPVAKSIPL